MIPLFKVFMSPESIERVTKVLQSGFIGQGPVVDEFEDELAKVLGVKFPVTTNSCTSAIHAVLTHLGIGPGDEVITSPLTCIATNAPIISLGARPVWADVCPFTGLITEETVAAKMTRRTRAIIGVNWTGSRVDWRSMRRFAVPKIEDAAHGPLLDWHGDSHDPDFTCFSFGPIKHLSCGDGGAVVAKDVRDAEAIRLLRWYGLDRRSSQDFRCAQDIRVPGLKWHMTDINAALGLGNLQHLRTNISAHRHNAYVMWEALSKANLHYLRMPPYDLQSNYWVFPLYIHSSGANREELKVFLTERGVMASQVHARNDKHTGYDYPVGTLAGLDDFDEQQLNVPCGWWMGQSDVKQVVDALCAFARQ